MTLRRFRFLPVHLAVALLALAHTVAAWAAPAKIGLSDVAQRMGSHVFMATGSALPSNFVPTMRKAAVARATRTNVYYMSTFATAQNFAPEVTDKWHPHLFFVSSQNRDAAKNGNATLHRESLFTLAKEIRAGKYPFDTVIVRVSPPDADGMVSLGSAGDLTLMAVEQVKARGGQVIAEVNPNVAHTFGNRMKYDDLSAVIDGTSMLSEHNGLEPGAGEKQIAAHIARLVPNRARSTIQVGIGNSLTGVGEALKGKRGMRIWSEMGSDWVRPLMEGDKPVVKEAVFSFLHGTNKLYAIGNNNPNLRMASTEEVNDPATIAQKTRIRAINTALEVDLTGNVNAERIGDRLISFPGGQPDFMIGASTSKNGLAILALRSRNKDGGSTIVPKLNSDVVTTAKDNVDHVVTEWGATRKLRGLSDSDRTYEMLRVSHPALRVGLAKDALDKGIITQARYEKLARSVYHSIRMAPESMRREVADEAFAKQLVTEAQHQTLVAGLPAVAAPAVAVAQ
ncbi:MAG: acetyl-CoA hydrolase/transferase C-terminal domain-containing protein [Polyangia bacterium]